MNKFLKDNNKKIRILMGTMLTLLTLSVIVYIILVYSNIIIVQDKYSTLPRQSLDELFIFGGTNIFKYHQFIEILRWDYALEGISSNLFDIYYAAYSMAVISIISSIVFAITLTIDIYTNKFID